MAKRSRKNDREDVLHRSAIACADAVLGAVVSLNGKERVVFLETVRERLEEAIETQKEENEADV